MAAVPSLRFVPARKLEAYICGTRLLAVPRPDLAVSFLSSRYAGLVDIEFIPIDRGGISIWRAWAHISVIATHTPFRRRIEIGRLQGADVLLGSDLLDASGVVARSSTSTNRLAAARAIGNISGSSGTSA